MSILSYPTKEQFDSTKGTDLGFVSKTFGMEVGGVTVEDVDVGGWDIDCGG